MVAELQIGFIGLGVMGFPMAGHLQQAGLSVTVYNRSLVKAERWSETYGGSFALSPAELAVDMDIIFICVGADEDVEEVCFGAGGIAANLAAGAIIVDHTTTSAELARKMAMRFADQGVHFLDAPVSGGQAGAQSGQLTAMLGGDDNSYQRVSPLLDTYCRQHRLLGPSGNGQLAKMVNQICIAGIVQGLAEGLDFARQAGLDAAAVVEVISQGAAQSWQMENRYKTMLVASYDFGFAVDWMRKDLGYALTEARRNGSHLPLTALVDQFYSEVQAMGGGRWDTSSLIARLQRDKSASR